MNQLNVENFCVMESKIKFLGTLLSLGFITSVLDLFTLLLRNFYCDAEMDYWLVFDLTMWPRIMVQKSMKEMRHDLVWWLVNHDKNAAKKAIFQELQGVKSGRKTWIKMYLMDVLVFCWITCIIDIGMSQWHLCIWCEYYVIILEMIVNFYLINLMLVM